MGKSRTTTVQEGEQLRGFLVKLLPEAADVRWLARAQDELMAAWNTLVISRQTHVDHCVRWCEDQGLLGPLPTRPKTERDTNVPEEIEEWDEYERLCGKRRFDAVTQTRQVEELTWDKWRIDYKTLRGLFGGKESVASAQMYLSLCHTFQRTKGPKLKKNPRKMPLLNRTGGHAITIPEGVQTRVTKSGAVRLAPGQRQCQVAFGPLRMKARFHRLPPGSFVEGVSIKLHSDGWFAAARCRVVPRALELPTKEVIAINAGLECLYADSEGHVIENPRGNAYSLRIREFDDAIDDAARGLEDDDHWVAERRHLRHVYQERLEGQVKALIYSDVLQRLAPYDIILLGASTKKAAQGRQTRISRNDEGGYVSAMSLMQQLIIQRYGLYDPDKNPTGRVRVVECVGISRKCSRCGTEHPTRYQRSNLRRADQITDCQEPSCRARIHVDVNAACNLRANYLDLQRAAE